MIFLDNASTTKMYDECVDVILNSNKNEYFNPGALYKSGSKLLLSINEIRKNFLSYLNGGSFDNIIFTGSATESNNLAILGSVRNKNSKLLFSMGEHPSVFNVAKSLQSQGYNVEFVNLTKDGRVDFNDLKEKMTKEVSFVSIMHVSNETGAVNDIEKLSSYCRQINPKVIFHSDGVQAFGKIKVDVNRMGVDLYTISSHKIHGPKGIGALYVNKNINLKPIIIGGGQEGGLRSGTENYAGIKAFDMAAKIITSKINDNFKYVGSLSDLFVQELSNNIESVKFNGCSDSKYIISFSLPGAKAETILHMLDEKGVLVSNGSACSTKKVGNRILENMGISRENIESSLRVSFSEFNSKDEVKVASKYIKEVYDEYLSLVKR